MKKKIRTSAIIRILFALAVIFLLNIVGSGLHFRIDLTKEKRYSLSDQTKTILKNLDQMVFIRVYLEGEMNIQLTAFQKSIRDQLDEFRVYAGANLQYEFSNPLDETNPEKRNAVIEELYHIGLRPVNIHHRKKDGSLTEKLIIPGATVNYNGMEIPLNLLLNDPTRSGDENLNNSVEALEYTLISTIKTITSEEIERIAFLEGHGEWSDELLTDLMQELAKSYQVDRGTLNAQPGILDPYSCVVIAGPAGRFSESDKYVLDQYIMKGGRVLWLLDAVNVNFDSLAVGYTLGLPNQLNLEDMLFRYGVRINPMLVRDIQCSMLPVNLALAGNKPDFQLAPWVYYPVVSPAGTHPIVKNINPVWLRFASAIDTLQGRSEIKKTPLLQSSAMSGLLQTPAIITLHEVNTALNPTDLANPNQILAVLLEGEFESVFKNRMLDEYFTTPPAQSLQKSKPTKMIVVADADLVRNELVQTEKGYSALPLGFDRATKQTFGNKEFLVNSVQYLTDDSNLLELRGREFKLRLLNKSKMASERLKWQLINLLIPVLLVIAGGLAYTAFRNYYYTRP